MRAHPLHRGERAWPESNCYVDLWIELLHASGVEPVAALPFTLAVDLEGDQWTFFKFPLADLDALYGVEVFELNVWRPLPAHLEEQLALGRPVIVEVDAFYLPDTVGTSYRAEHVKTSIAVQAIDIAGRRLGYFHNAGYYELDGHDFAGALRTESPPGPEYLAPYVEVVKSGRAAPAAGRDLAARSVSLLRMHLQRRPVQNPFRRYAAQLGRRSRVALGRIAPAVSSLCVRDTPAVRRGIRAGRCLSAVARSGAIRTPWNRSRAPVTTSPVPAKALQFKIARVVQTRRAFDPAAAARCHGRRVGPTHVRPDPPLRVARTRAVADRAIRDGSRQAARHRGVTAAQWIMGACGTRAGRSCRSAGAGSGAT